MSIKPFTSSEGNGQIFPLERSTNTNKPDSIQFCKSPGISSESKSLNVLEPIKVGSSIRSKYIIPVPKYSQNTVIYIYIYILLLTYYLAKSETNNISEFILNPKNNQTEIDL